MHGLMASDFNRLSSLLSGNQSEQSSFWLHIHAAQLFSAVYLPQRIAQR